MANHKRKRPKNRRAGCLLCKPWKVNGVLNSKERYRMSERKQRQSAQEQIEELG